MTHRRRRAPTVLHVEDNVPMQHLRAEILRRAGWSVANVRTVRDAVAAATKKRPDLILCDVKLPDGSGFQICREIHAVQPGVPVVLISAIYRDEFSEQSAIYGGASGYLVEPLSPDELVAALSRHLG